MLQAAQALEPAALVAMRLVRPGGSVTLVGDPKQLPATVLSQAASARHLAQSLFERLQRVSSLCQGAVRHIGQNLQMPDSAALVGDPKQLPATVLSQAASARHLAQSTLSVCGMYVLSDLRQLWTAMLRHPLWRLSHAGGGPQAAVRQSCPRQPLHATWPNPFWSACNWYACC